MNIKIIEPRSNKTGDINFSPNGMATINAEFVKQYRLDQKKILFAIDTDDKEHRFLFLAVDTNNKNPRSISIKKSKSGSYQLSLKNVAKELMLTGKKANFTYYKHLTDKGETFIQFQKTGD